MMYADCVPSFVTNLIFIVFGVRPCDTFPKLTTAEFADHFFGTIKAADEVRTTYVRHLALLVCLKTIRGDI